MKGRRTRLCVIFICCIIMNLAGKYLAYRLNLPLWLDMTGTCVAAYFLGLPASIIVALLNNIVFAFVNGTSYLYGLTSLVCALFFSFFAKKGFMNKLQTAVLSGFWAGAVSVIVSTPLNIYIHDGYSGNVWGDALVDMLVWHGTSKEVAAAFGELLIDVIDKQVCIVLGYLIIKLINNKSENNSHLTHKTAAEKIMSAVLICALAAQLAAPVCTVSAQTTDASRAKAAETTSVADGVQTTEADSVQSTDVLPKTGAAQDEDGDDSVSYSSTIYNNMNGLMSSEANAIAGTDDGYIWIGSYAGLTRYDGTTFEFMLGENIAGVMDLLCDSKGRLWIGTNDGGIFRYETGEFVQFTKKDGLPADSVRCFYETDDGMYVATTDRLCFIDNEDHIETLAADVTYVVSMTMCDGALVCVSKDGGIYVVDEEGDVMAAADAGSSLAFTCVQNTDRGLLAGTTGEDFYVLQADGDTVRTTGKITSPITDVKQIVGDESGVIWACGSNGLCYIDGSDSYHEVDVEGFDASMEDVYIDYQGNIWAASSSTGVMKLTDSLFDNLFTDSGVAAAVCNAVAEYDGCLYCGTDSGLVVIDESTGQKKTGELTKLVGESRVRSILADDEGGLWLCTYDGLICMDKDGDIRTYTEEDSDMVTSNRVRCIAQTGDESFAVGTADGMFFVESGKVTGCITTEDGLENPQILCLTVGADGLLYAGSDGAGVYAISDKKITGCVNTDSGLSSNVVMRLVPYGDVMIAVTSNSLCTMTNTPDSVAEDVKILREFPFYNNYDVLVSGDVAYVLSSAGIYAVNVDKLAAGDELVYSLYSAKNGLTSGLMANSWNFVSDDGMLYFCCNDGVVTFDSMGESEEESYRYGISSMVCNGESVDISGMSDTYKIPGDAENVTLSATLRNYSLTDVKVKFYQESEKDKAELMSASAINDVTIMWPEAGEYKVFFQIYDMSGAVLMDQHVYTLTKESQMWERGWFKLYIVFVVLESVLMLLWSVACIVADRRKRSELERFADELAEKVEEQRQKLIEEGRDKDKMLMNTVVALSGTVDAKDRYTSGHSSRVAKYSRMLAARMGKSEEEQENVYCAGLLHDVGKIRVPEAIINKPGRLTDDEYEMIKLHPITGYHILKTISANTMFADGAKFHHERYDGHGYPNGLAGKAIPEIARIIGVADAYDAMASNRSYRAAMAQEDIRREIETNKGTQFDPEIADIMLQLIDEDTEYTMREAAYSKRKVLVVDDEPDELRQIEDILAGDQIYDVQGAGSDEEIRAALAGGQYDVILLDMEIAGMDGYAVAQDIRGLCAAPVIFITTDNQAVDMEKARTMGVDDFITKPFMAAAVKEIVHAVLTQ